MAHVCRENYRYGHRPGEKPVCSRLRLHHLILLARHIQNTCDGTIRQETKLVNYMPTGKDKYGRRVMNIGLVNLIAQDSLAHVDEAKAFHFAKQAVGGQRGPANFDELQYARRSVSPASPNERVMEHVAKVGDNKVSIRIFKPDAGSSRAIYLDIHGGGFYMGSAIQNDTRNAYLSNTLCITVVSVDYRLAPENPWPAAPDDCETAAIWLIKEGRKLFDSDQIFIGGASAGATLAMTTLFRLRDQGLIEPIEGAVLQFGAYDLSGQSPGGRLYANEWFIQAYAGHVLDKTAPDVSPLYGDLRSLPQTFLIVGTLDVLLEDNLAMAARLSAAWNDVDLRVFPDSMHGFTSHPTQMAATALVGIENWLASRLK